MRNLTIPAALLAAALFWAGCAANSGDDAPAPAGVHRFQVNDISGEPVDLTQYEGKVLLIVNTASECGYTPQYAGLVDLHDFAVLGFPANNFGGQEPGTDAEIQRFCSATYGVDFPMFSKLSVKGEDQAPLFTYLTSAENPDFTGAIKWNFEKFLVGGDGRLLRRFRSKVKPGDEPLKAAIRQALTR